MQPDKKTLPSGNKTNRKWAIGALMALTMLGAVAVSGAVVGKSQPVIAPIDLPLDAVLIGRLWVEDVTGTGEYIDVESFSWGVTQPVDTSGGGGGATGKASFQDFHFTTHLSKFSPELAKTLISGKHIKKVVFEEFTSSEKKGNETIYLQVTLSDCLITSYQIGGSNGGNDMPTEEITFVFGKIEFSYIGSDPSQSSSFTYDLKEGKF